MRILLLVFAVCSSTYAVLVNSDAFRPIVEEVNKLQTTWKAESNLPPHLTLSSIKSLLGVKRTGLKLQAKPTTVRSNITIPQEFDARKQWPNCPTISHIWDQGICGSCWAVAAAAAFSDRVCIATNGTFKAQLSAEELLACCAHCGDGCNGGEPLEAWKFFNETGLVTGGDYQSNEGCQPYSIQACEHRTEGPLPACSSLPLSPTPQCHQNCTNNSYNSSNFLADHQKTKDVYNVSTSLEAIQEEIMTHGPVEADFTVYADFATYKSGVYQHVTGEELGGHAVRVIGWGIENGTPYWLATNNWNTHWGDNGLFKIRRGVNECGFESNMIAGIPVATSNHTSGSENLLGSNKIVLIPLVLMYFSFK